MGSRAADRTLQRRREHQASRRDRCKRASDQPVDDGGPGQRLHWRRRPAGQPAEGALVFRATGAMARTGSGTPCRPRASRPASPVGNPGPSLSVTTSAGTKAETHRDHVRTAQGLAACCHSIRSMPDRLPARHRPRLDRAVLAMGAEPKLCSLAMRRSWHSLRGRSKISKYSDCCFLLGLQSFSRSKNSSDQDTRAHS